MTDTANTTPAVGRATEAVAKRATWPSIHWGHEQSWIHPEAAAEYARAGLAAALDAVDIAGILLTHDDMLWVPSGDMECPCGYRVPADNADVSTLRAHQVDAIRTAMLGEA